MLKTPVQIHDRFSWSLWIIVAIVFLGLGCDNDNLDNKANKSEPEVRMLLPRIVAEWPHDITAFTQGLELVDGVLIESTGRFGASSLRVVEHTSGKVIDSQNLAKDFFGEGVTSLRDGRIVQLTWKSQQAIVWKISPLTPVQFWNYEGEGWGICLLDDGRLATSDGSSSITLRRTKDFSPIETIRVTLEGKPIDNLNELECVGSTIWANVWLTDQIMAIDSTNGTVIAVLDARLLPVDRSRLGPNDVLNGIAYDSDSGHFLLTGKRWPSIFEVQLTDVETDSSN